METAIKSTCGKIAALAIAGTLALDAVASSITIDSVAQRWPWNNKIDITYTVTDGQTLTADPSNDVYMKIVFTAVIDGTTYAIDGNAIGASATGSAEGTQHTATWIPPSNLKVKASGCTMSAALYAADVPSGDDYMVIDLESNDPATAVHFEGLLHSQELSNARYNTDLYKTSKMVLRKVPRWANREVLPNASSLPADGYPTGDNTSANSYSSASNQQTNWVTRADYYIGVFPVTQAQYVKFGQSNPSAKTDVIEGNEVGHRPVESMTWNDLRVAGTGYAEPVPPVEESNTGTYLQRLNYATGNRYAFDLPTEVMSEIACRAGVAGTHYYWTSGALGTYAVFNTSSTLAVGSKTPNAWGLYDTIGNVWEFCLDRSGLSNMADNVDPFVPYEATGSSIRVRGSGTYNSNVVRYFYASYRNYAGRTWSSHTCGFRVSCIVK